MKTLIIAIAAALLARPAVNAQTTSSVAGVVLENGVRPLSGAIVTYMTEGRVQKDSKGQIQYLLPKVIGSVQTRVDGSFTVSGLPAGLYAICARGTDPVHLSSCQLDNPKNVVSVVSGQDQTGLKLNVPRGALLDITLTDSSGCAAKNSRAPVYVFVNSISQQAYLVSSASGAYHYRALVPQQVPLQISSNHPCTFAEIAPGTRLSVPPIQSESASASITAR
jgi:hypothetical protein